MTDRQPSEVTNPDQYGDPVVTGSRAHDLLASGPKGPLAAFLLGLSGRTGPHAAGNGALWARRPASPGLDAGREAEAERASV